MKRLSKKKAAALIGGGGYTVVLVKKPGNGVVIEIYQYYETFEQYTWLSAITVIQTTDGVEGPPFTEFFPPGRDA